MTAVGAFLSRRLPGARKRAVESAFKHGVHAGKHAAAGTECGHPSCDVFAQLQESRR